MRGEVVILVFILFFSFYPFFFFKEKARGILFPGVAFSLPLFFPESKESRNNRGTSPVHSKLTCKVIWWRHYFHHVTSHLGNTQRFIWFLNEVCTPQLGLMLYVYVLSCSVMSDSLCPMNYIAHQVPLSKAFPRQGYWHGLPFLSPGDLPDPGIEPTSLVSPALAGRFFTTSATWQALCYQSLIPHSHQALINILEALFSFPIWHPHFFSLCILLVFCPPPPPHPWFLPTL